MERVAPSIMYNNIVAPCSHRWSAPERAGAWCTRQSENDLSAGLSISAAAWRRGGNDRRRHCRYGYQFGRDISAIRLRAHYTSHVRQQSWSPRVRYKDMPLCTEYCEWQTAKVKTTRASDSSTTRPCRAYQACTETYCTASGWDVSLLPSKAMDLLIYLFVFVDHSRGLKERFIDYVLRFVCLPHAE